MEPSRDVTGRGGEDGGGVQRGAERVMVWERVGKASEEEIAHSLQGNWQADVLFELEQALEGYDFHQRQILACDGKLQKYLAALPSRETIAAAATPKVEKTARQRKKARATRKAKDN